MWSKAALRRAAPGLVVQTRGMHVTPQPKLQKLSVGGRGGRSSSSGKRVVVFGAGGFLGRYVANVLGQQGHQVILPNRGCEMEYRHLRPMFDLGQAGFPFYHARDENSIRHCLAGADMVISLVGKQYETKAFLPNAINFSFEDVNDRIPANLARLAKEAGAGVFVHVSALNQDAESESRWARSKADGETNVRAAFPEATILRPAILFGVEDTFLNYFASGASWPVTPITAGGEALVQPVYVGDVARAVVNAMNSDRAQGKTFELVGPDEYTVRECAEYVYDVTGLENNLMDLPLPALKFMGDAFNSMPSFSRPLFSRDHAIMMAAGSTKDPASSLGGLDALKVEPHAMEKVAWNYLHRHRAGGHFTLASGYHKDVKTE